MENRTTTKLTEREQAILLVLFDYAAANISDIADMYAGSDAEGYPDHERVCVRAVGLYRGPKEKIYRGPAIEELEVWALSEKLGRILKSELEHPGTGSSGG